MDRFKSALAWLAISTGVAGIGSHFFGLAFWPSALVVGLALIANGLLADWEDRGEFND